MGSLIVTPVYKGKGSPYDADNYRPISVIPTFSKILEKAIYFKINNKLRQDGILKPQQHGFMNGKSCQSALTSFTNDIYRGIDSRNGAVGAVFVDLKKAFNSLDYLKLMDTLRNEFKFCDPLFNILCDYFINRTFHIKLGDFKSQVFNIHRGLVQGSLIGPILFNLYYNKVYEAFLDIPGVSYCLFADDLVFYCNNQSGNKIEEKLNIALNNLHKWCLSKDLNIHFGKPKWMLFSKTQKSTPIDSSMWTISCEGSIIEKVDQFRYLGVIIDHYLGFNQHYEATRTKISSAIGCLNRIRKYLSEQAFIVLLNSFVLSIIDYGLPI